MKKLIRDPSDPLICLCNGVAKSKIKEAIAQGASTLDEIYDQTSAGVGACGGSCRNKLRQILDAETLLQGEALGSSCPILRAKAKRQA